MQPVSESKSGVLRISGLAQSNGSRTNIFHIDHFLAVAQTAASRARGPCDCKGLVRLNISGTAKH